MQLKQKTNPALRPLRPILQLTGADILCHGMISYFLRCATRLSPLCHGILYFIPTHWYHHVQITHWSSLFSSHMNGCTGVNLNQYYCWPIFQKNRPSLIVCPRRNRSGERTIEASVPTHFMEGMQSLHCKRMSEEWELSAIFLIVWIRGCLLSNWCFCKFGFDNNTCNFFALFQAINVFCYFFFSFKPVPYAQINF